MKNFVFISPHFPDSFYKFVVALKNNGFRVLGIGDDPYENLRPELKSALAEYYVCHNMDNIENEINAVRYFENKYGKYPRKLIYGYNVKNTSNTIEYLPFQCDLDSTFTSYFKVTCRNYKFKVKTMLNNIWKKQHFFILPEQSLPIEFLIEIPSEISKHTTIELTKEINVTYRMSVVNLIFPTNVVLDNSCYQLFHKGKESFPKSMCGPF